MVPRQHNRDQTPYTCFGYGRWKVATECASFEVELVSFTCQTLANWEICFYLLLHFPFSPQGNTTMPSLPQPLLCSDLSCTPYSLFCSRLGISPLPCRIVCMIMCLFYTNRQPSVCHAIRTVGAARTLSRIQGLQRKHGGAGFGSARDACDGAEIEGLVREQRAWVEGSGIRDIRGMPLI